MVQTNSTYARGNPGIFYDIIYKSRGVAQLVARAVRDCEVARSNRVAPTTNHSKRSDFLIYIT